MNEQYPMIDGGSIFRISDIAVAWRRLLLKLRNIEGNASFLDFTDNLKDAKLLFDEYPNCESCGAIGNKEMLRAIDGNRVVECVECGLWYTSPRIRESLWAMDPKGWTT